MYLLTEWEDRSGKYLAQGHCRSAAPRAKYFPVRPELTHIQSKYFIV